MNRFQREQRHLLPRGVRLLPAASFLLLFFLFWSGVSSVSGTALQKQEESLNTAVLRSVIQCYAVEGTYPPSLNYLKEHYGPTYDESLFYVDYRAVGGNLMPDVTVIRQ